MTPESSLERLRESLQPADMQRERVRTVMQRRIDGSAALLRARDEATPSDAQKQHVWQGIVHRIELPALTGMFDRVRALLTPSVQQQFAMRSRMFMRLSPVQVRSSYSRSKWVAAFVLVLLALRVSPALFLAPQTIAESSVMLLPTRGNVEIALHALWQPVVDEFTIDEPLQLRTDDGEATIILHDDGTIRLASDTKVSLHDVSDRPEPSIDGPTLTVSQGQVWVQGLLPKHLRGITIATPYGSVTVHAGSVSIAVEDGRTTVRVWDRQADVSHAGVATSLIAGDRARFGEAAQLSVTELSNEEYAEDWVAQNLRRDAVHQREVAQMQQERRAAQAGILPTSPLYPVKRVAEKVDVLLTLSPEAKVQKQLQQASTRLNEAAALLADGGTGAVTPLKEYKEALLAIASGSGGDSVTQFMVRQQVAENTADIAAALPSDELYPLKETVLRASVELAVSTVDASDVDGILLVDTLDALRQSIDAGDAAGAQATFTSLQPYLSSLEENDSLKPDVKKEVMGLLSKAAEKLQLQSGTGLEITTLSADLEPYLPKPPAVPTPTPLTDEEINVLVADIRARILVYSQARSRWNQLQQELVHLQGHYDEGRILRRLYDALPENGLARYVRVAIQELRERVEQ